MGTLNPKDPCPTSGTCGIVMWTPVNLGTAALRPCHLQSTWLLSWIPCSCCCCPWHIVSCLCPCLHVSVISKSQHFHCNASLTTTASWGTLSGTAHRYSDPVTHDMGFQIFLANLSRNHHDPITLLFCILEKIKPLSCEWLRSLAAVEVLAKPLWTMITLTCDYPGSWA